jgi:predicted transcriptional regulator
MDNETAPQPARSRLNPYTKALRRERIFSRLQLGASSADIAREEGLSEQRVRKIVADALKRWEVDEPRDHALLQLVRPEGAQALAARTVAAGDLKAIAPYLQVLDRLDRYRKKTGAARKVYDDDARERLFAKLSRTVARLDAEVRKSARRAAAEPRLGPDAEKEPDSELNL